MYDIHSLSSPVKKTHHPFLVSGKSLLLVGFISLFVVAQFALTIVYYASAYHFQTMPQLCDVINFTRALNAVIASCDAVLAGVLVYLLHHSRTGFKLTDTIIVRLMVFTINTGLLTGVSAVLCLISSFVFDNSAVYLMFYMMIPHRKVLFVRGRRSTDNLVTICSLHELVPCNVSLFIMLM